MDDKRLNELWSKNEDTLIRILKYLKRYKNGRVFDDVFAELSKSIPDLTMAYVLSLIEILKEKKFITYSMRDEILYYNISEIAREFTSVKKVKKEIKKDKTNTNENMQYVADCLKEIEDFKNKIVLLIAEKEKNLIAETNNKIASLKLEKEKKENYLNSLGFFAFSQKNNTKHEIEKTDSMIASLKAESYIAQTVGLWSQKAEKLVTKYESDMKKYLNNKYSVPFNSFPIKVDYSKPKKSLKPSVPTKSNARKPTAMQMKNAEVAEGILNHLKITRKKLSISEMIEEILVLNSIPDCTPQYVMAMIRPLKDKGLIARTEANGNAYFYATDPQSTKVEHSKLVNIYAPNLSTETNSLIKVQKEIKPSDAQVRFKKVTEGVLNHLKITRKKLTISEMIEKIPALKAIPDCTPQFVMAIIRPLLIEGLIARTEIEGAAYFYYDGPTVKPEELYDVMTPYEIDEKFAHLEKPESPNINSIFN